MRVRRFLPVFAVVVLAACSSNSTSSSTPAPAPQASASASASASTDLCTAWSDLKTSVANLKKIDVVSGGTNAIQTAMQDVQAKFDTFHAAARTDFGPQATAMSDALSTAQTALQNAAASPGIGTIGALATSVSGVISAFNSLQTAVSSRCG